MRNLEKLQQRSFGVAKTPTSAAAVDITAVRNLNDEDRMERLEIEVKNLSNKPIYFLEIHIYFPQAIGTADDGTYRPMGISLEYGRYDLMKEGRASSEDLPINPGGRHVFKIPEDKRNGLRQNMAYRGKPGKRSIGSSSECTRLALGTEPDSGPVEFPFRNQQVTNDQ